MADAPDLLADLQASIDQARAERRAREERRMTRAKIRKALSYLPATCPCHGDRLDLRPDAVWHEIGLRACCDRGAPALARRGAIAALDAEMTGGEQG